MLRGECQHFTSGKIFPKGLPLGNCPPAIVPKQLLPGNCPRTTDLGWEWPGADAAQSELIAAHVWRGESGVFARSLRPHHGPYFP